MHWLLSPVSSLLWVWFSSERILGHEKDSLLSFVFLPHIAHHAQDVPEVVVQSNVRWWGRVLKNTNGVLFQCSTLKIGRHFLFWHPNLSIQLKCTAILKVVVSDSNSFLKSWQNNPAYNPQQNNLDNNSWNDMWAFLQDEKNILLVYYIYFTFMTL